MLAVLLNRIKLVQSLYTKRKVVAKTIRQGTEKCPEHPFIELAMCKVAAKRLHYSLYFFIQKVDSKDTTRPYILAS
jgi:hypothetical protein